ncbi:MAG: membrane-associated phospholipid phosphatase [Gammaproteobacteria bacterium]
MNPIIKYLCLSIISISISNYASAGENNYNSIFSGIWQTIENDHKEFYSRNRLLRMAGSIGVGAALANTSAGESFQNWYQDDVRSKGTNDFSDVTKNFGEYKYILPSIITATVVNTLLQDYFDDSFAGDWGKRTMRAYILGTPVLWASQRVIGASRPKENRGSNWRPFDDSNGASGHAFAGAVPFLTLARMNDDNKFLKYVFYAASTLTALSRINDGSHYLSQSAIGWYLAWEATDTISDRERKERLVTMNPMMIPDGYGIQVGMIW